MSTQEIIAMLRDYAEYLEKANIDKKPRELMRVAANRLEELNNAATDSD